MQPKKFLQQETGEGTDGSTASKTLTDANEAKGIVGDQAADAATLKTDTADPDAAKVE